MGYVTIKDKGYLMTSEADELFGRPGSSKYIGHSTHHALRLVEKWLEIPEVIKSGKPDRRKRTAEDREHFIGSMDANAREVAPYVVELCLKKLAGVKSVVDIGGGPGSYSKAFLNRGVKATLFDLPEVIELLKEYKNLEGVELMGGDFNVTLPPGPFDLAFLSNITHIYGPEENKALLKRVVNILSPKGSVAILDFVRGRSLSAPLFAVNMLVNTENGGTWSEEEYLSWFEKAGFEEVGIFDIEPRDQQLILATKI